MTRRKGSRRLMLVQQDGELTPHDDALLIAHGVQVDRTTTSPGRGPLSAHPAKQDSACDRHA